MRWTLSRKILCLAMLNLLLVALAMLLFLRQQYRFGAENILLGSVHDHLIAVADEFRLEMDSSPREGWPGLLEVFGRRYHADFFLVAPRGEPIAGEPVDLPAELKRRMHGNRPPRRENPPPMEWPMDSNDAPPPRQERRPPPPGQGDPAFLVITANPTAYWTGVHFPLGRAERNESNQAILLIRSHSLFQNDLVFNWRLTVGLPSLLVVVSALCWLPFIRGLSRSIAQMDRVTGQIAQGRFDVHAPVNRADELGHLGKQVNVMASKLESFVRNQKRFLGDIAHELCAPIARIQFALGILEQQAEPTQQSHVLTLRNEIQEMSDLVNELLSFSKAGMEPGQVALTPVDVASVAQRAVAREAAENIEIQVEPGLRVLANEPYLVRSVSNLVRNAVRYAGDAGPIVVSARRSGGEVLIVVADSGPGLPPGELEQVFAPFYRPESSRSRDFGGVGLGLAIVKTCVEACRGAVSCKNRTPSGLEVTIRLAPAP